MCLLHHCHPILRACAEAGSRQSGCIPKGQLMACLEELERVGAGQLSILQMEQPHIGEGKGVLAGALQCQSHPIRILHRTSHPMVAQRRQDP